MRASASTLISLWNGVTAKNLRGRFQVMAATLMAVAMLTPLTVHGQNFVYVTNRTATTNTISAFSVDAGGVVTAVPGSPFSTGGTGANIVCAAVDRITVSPSRNLLFVSNSGDQTISVFTINTTTGVLTAVPGSPFASGLTLDSCGGMSLAATPNGNFLMASSNGTINTFSVAANGALALASSVSGLPTPMVGMKISGDGTFLAVSHQLSVSIFTIAADGSLAAAPGSPFTGTGSGKIGGLEFSCDAKLLYAGEGGTATSITDAWSVGATGALSALVGSPFTAAGSDSNVVFLTPDNTILLQSNQGSSDMNQFTLNPDGTLTSIGSFNIAAGHVPAGLSSDNSGQFLYAADDAFGLAVFNIIPGVVPTLVADTPITGAGQIQGVAAYPPRSCARTDFSITQTASPNPVVKGSNITYTITLTNNGPSTASVAINDLLPKSSVSFVSCSASPNGVCDKGAGLNRTITFSSLAAGQSGTVTIVAAANVSTLLNGDIIANTSTVSNASAVDPLPANNSASTSVTVSAPLSATNFIVSNSTGSYTGTTNLTTTLKRTLNGAAVAGRTITFSLNGIVVGTAVTDANGIASLPNVSLFLNGLPITAGTYIGGIGVSFAGDTQYAASTGSSTLTVNKATLTVTAQNATRVYGDPNPAFTYVISGFLNNETVAVVSGTASCTSSANLNTSAGTVPISCSIGTLSATNYNFVFVAATLTITPAPLVLAANNATRLYGDPNPAFTGTVVGLKAGDQATATFSTAAVSTTPVGSYPILGTVVPGPSFLASNYSITSSGNLSITPAPLSATATDASRIYGDPNPAFTGTVTGVKNGDVFTTTFTSVADPTSPVGTYSIVAAISGAAASNYTVTTNNGILTITPAALSVTPANATRLYGDPNPAFTGTISGLKNADNITANYASAAVAASAVGPYPIAPTLVDPTAKLTNYTVTLNNGTLTVGPAPLSVTPANASRLYGDANPPFSGTITGIKNGDNITAAYSSAADPTTAVGTASIIATLVDPTLKLSNYTVALNNGALTINPAPLTITGANASRLYGDPNPAFTGTITGLKNADNITATFGSAATATDPVGSYSITPTLVDPAAKLGNYAVTSVNGTLTVNPAPLAVSGANATRVYGDPNPAFTGTITGLKNADNITATFASVATPASAVGNYPVTGTLVDTTAKLGNYAVTSTPGTLTVSAAPLTVTAGDATRIYGDANPAFGGTITGLKNSDNITAVYSSTATVASPVGTYPLSASLLDPTNKLGNYTVTSNNGTLTVTPAPLSVTAGNAARAYGDPNPTLGGTIVGLKNADAITATYASIASAISVVGSYPIVPTLVDPTAKLGNYTVSSNNGALTVNPAALTVSAANASRLYGDPNPAFTGTITGLKNNDAITATFATAATAANPVGSYPIVATLADPTAKLSNYTVTSNNGVLTISPAPLTVSGASVSRVYGDPNPIFSGAVTGLKNGDNITATFATTATAASPVGSYAIVPSLVDPTNKLSNYALTSNNGTLTVTPAPLALSADNATRVYGDPNPAFTGAITGLKNGDAITLSFTSADATSPVGTIPIVPGAVDPTGKLPNYTVAATNGALTITPAPLSISANNSTRIYGDANPAFTSTIIGLKNGDPITASFTSADALSPVGTYAIVPAAVDPAGKLGNYTVALNNGTLTVTPAALSVVAANATRAYGDPNPAFTGTITGLKNADNITASYSSSATAVTPVGTASIVPTLADPAAKLGNYTVTLTNATLNISPAALNVSAANATRFYGDPNPPFSGTITGLKNGDNITASYASAATPASAVGTFAIVPTLADPTAKLANYSVTSSNGTLTVSPAALTVAGANATRLYGDANPAFTGTITGLKNGDNITAAFGSAATAASAVGAYPITATLADPTSKLANYAVTSVDGTLTVNPAPLAAAGNSVSRLYGDANPAFTGTLTGLKNGDAITATFSAAADATSAVGIYPIAPAFSDPGSKLPNYTVSSTGTLTVGPAPLTVTAANASRIYGDPNPAFTGTIIGLRNADNIGATFTSAGPASAVGTYAIVPALSDPAGKLGNYSVTANNGTLTVGPAALSVAAADASRPYGSPNPAFTGTLTGIKNGDNITANFTTLATAVSAVGTYPIVPVLADPGSKLSNYSVGSLNGTLTVGKATPVITLTAHGGASSALLVAVVQNAGPTLPSGTVQFSEGGTPLGSPVTLASANAGAAPQAQFVASLTAGTHTIDASYSGDGTYTSATGASVTVVVSAGTPQFSFSGAGGNTSATIQAGQTATYNLSLGSQGFLGTVALGCSGAPAGTTCTVNPASVDLNGSSSSVPITVTVSGTQNARSLPVPFRNTMLFVFGGVFMGMASSLRKKRNRAALALMGLFIIGGLTACGGAGGSTPPPPSPKPPTTATLVVTGNSGSQTASINLNLTINH